MRISVVTITVRKDPRLVAMASSLLASLERARKGRPELDLEWVVVDVLMMSRGQTWSQLAALMRETALGMDIKAVDPDLQWGAGDEDDDDDEILPAHNSAKNVGLMQASGDYVVFLTDCTVVTSDWVATAAAVAEMGHGYRARQVTVADLKLDWGKPLTHGVIPDKKWKPAPVATIGGSCWGAPMAAFRQVGGFDLAYDGEVHCHDLECAIRLERTGLRFVTTTRSVAIRLRRTAKRSEVATRKENSGGTRNKNYLVELTKERDRTLPREGNPSLAPPIKAAAPAAAAPVLGASPGNGASGPGRAPARPGPAVAAAKPASAAQPIRRRPAAAAAPAAPAPRPARGGAPRPSPVAAPVHGAADAGPHGRDQTAADLKDDPAQDADDDLSDIDLDDIDAFVKATSELADLTQTVDLDPPKLPPAPIPDLPLGHRDPTPPNIPDAPLHRDTKPPN